ncbi:ABC transporter substrate-binding protein [Pseudorhodoferax sp.]|uniref:ABC transporter substrate-binding protein n=1 Tax=Pseudorhodoferax sp. TaxID=1993553 RepID=UPI002DD64DA7|nr:ABC transporter substrate-binding protein [Pseudorhodoferax sp.]
MHHPSDPARRRLVQAAAASALLPGLPLAAMAQERKPQRGGTLTILQRNEPPALVAVANASGPTKVVSSKIFEGLLRYDFALRPQPGLATAWQASKDAREFTFQLRRGVKWHDGQDFGAADVAHSIRLVAQLHPTGRVNFKSLAEVRTPDTHQVVVRFTDPNPGFLARLASVETPIVPRHLYEGRDYATNPANLKPVGTGPFVFQEWAKGSHLLLARNPHYWDEGKPYLDQIVLKIVPDFAAASSAFEAGSVDIGYNNPVALGDIDRIAKLPHIGVERRGYEYSGDWTSLVFNFENPYLKDLRVRQAIAHAIDRKALLNVAWYGKGRVIDSPIGASLARYQARDVQTYAFDPARAEKLLDEAGFPRKNGVRFALHIDPLPSIEGFRNSAQFLRQAFAKVGITLQSRTQDFASYIKRVYTDRDFDLAYAWLITGPDPAGVQSYYWSRNFQRGIPFSNASGIQNAELDRLFEQGAVEPDEARRIALYQQAQRLIAEQLPSLELLAFDVYSVFNRRVHNHTVGANGLESSLADTWVESA